MSPQNTSAEAQHRKDIVEATVVLYDLLSLKHTGITAQETDCKGENHNDIPGTWKHHQAFL